MIANPRDIVKFSLSGSIFGVNSILSILLFLFYLSHSHCLALYVYDNINIPLQETKQRERAAGSQRQQVPSSPSCLRQDMKGHHGDKTIHSQRGRAHADGQLGGAACFQTKNKWRSTRSKTLITSWGAIRGSSRQRKQRQGHSVILSCGIIIWTVRRDCAATFTDLWCLFWAANRQRKSKRSKDQE